MSKRSTSQAARGPLPEDDLLSIGDLAEAAGISPDTIRAWERRYGQPEAVRLPSGHRRYTPAHVRWLRRVAEALSLGHRPAGVVHLSERRLDALLDGGDEAARPDPKVVRLVDMVKKYAIPRLRSALLADLDKMGARRFLGERITPLLTLVGRAWADGEIDIRHEHMLSEVVEDVLRGLRAGLKAPRRGPIVVLTTLPGETHRLGLQMAAVYCGLASVRAHVLGPGTPLEEIAATVAETGARAVGLSVSLATGGVPTDRALVELRRMLPEAVRILVGGAGARGVRRGPHGIEYFDGWEELERWLRGLAAATRGGTSDAGDES